MNAGLEAESPMFVCNYSEAYTTNILHNQHGIAPRLCHNVLASLLNILKGPDYNFTMFYSMLLL